MLYILAYLFYKLQLLNISCFRALKRSYGTEIKKLIQVYITHISKKNFFPAFYTAFCTTITESNIRERFRKAGLVPYDPEYVISQLDIQVSTLTLPPTSSDLLAA
jgi:hypothetical protein